MGAESAETSRKSVGWISRVRATSPSVATAESSIAKQEVGRATHDRVGREDAQRVWAEMAT